MIHMNGQIAVEHDVQAFNLGLLGRQYGSGIEVPQHAPTRYPFNLVPGNRSHRSMREQTFNNRRIISHWTTLVPHIDRPCNVFAALRLNQGVAFGVKFTSIPSAFSG
jgi:hypothetical protein